MKRRIITVTGLLAIVAMLIGTTGVLATTSGPRPAKPINQEGIGGGYIKSHPVTVKIEDQIAVTKVEQVFVNESNRPAEGTYLFPLPVGAAVSNLVMYINGVPIQAQLLDAKQAQQIYTETV